MDITLYDSIFKRKSFHLFRNVGNEKITDSELKDIENTFKTLSSLDSSIKVEMRIEARKTNCKRGQEYCILFYSEKKNNYLENIGYIGEQLDLYLVSKNIGTLWYGIGRPEEKTYNGLDFVIMIAIKKVDNPSKFRKDMYNSKRKTLEETWHSERYTQIGDIARFAPSACNTQPWDVNVNGNYIMIKRISSKRGIMPQHMCQYYNSIDMGIYLCFLELCLMKNNMPFERIMAPSFYDEVEAYCCTYHMK